MKKSFIVSQKIDFIIFLSQNYKTAGDHTQCTHMRAHLQLAICYTCQASWVSHAYTGSLYASLISLGIASLHQPNIRPQTEGYVYMHNTGNSLGLWWTPYTPLTSEGQKQWDIYIGDTYLTFPLRICISKKDINWLIIKCNILVISEHGLYVNWIKIPLDIMHQRPSKPPQNHCLPPKRELWDFP